MLSRDGLIRYGDLTSCSLNKRLFSSLAGRAAAYLLRRLSGSAQAGRPCLAGAIAYGLNVVRIQSQHLDVRGRIPTPKDMSEILQDPHCYG